MSGVGFVYASGAVTMPDVARLPVHVSSNKVQPVTPNANEHLTGFFAACVHGAFLQALTLACCPLVHPHTVN